MATSSSRPAPASAPGIIGGIIGGNGQTGREGKLLSVLPKLKRYNFNLLAHYTVSDAFEPFVEAKWNRRRRARQQRRPVVHPGPFRPVRLPRARPARQPVPDPGASGPRSPMLILASGCNTSLTLLACHLRPGPTCGRPGIGGPLTAADIAAINAGTYRFVIARHLADVGIRDEKFQRDTYRIVGGAPRHLQRRLELRNLGQLRQVQGRHDDLRLPRPAAFMLAMDAGRNPVTGQIQCRSQFDPASAADIGDAIRRPIAANSGSPRSRHRGLRALQSVRRGPTTAPRPTISPTMHVIKASLEPARPPRLRRRRFRASCSSCQAARSASRSAANIARRTASYKDDPFVADGFTNARRHSATSIRRSVQGEGSLRRTSASRS